MSIGCLMSLLDLSYLLGGCGQGHSHLLEQLGMSCASGLGCVLHSCLLADTVPTAGRSLLDVACRLCVAPLGLMACRTGHCRDLGRVCAELRSGIRKATAYLELLQKVGTAGDESKAAAC